MKTFKIAMFLLGIFTVFYCYSYFFGSVYGGKKYQRKAIEGTARHLLGQYQKTQSNTFDREKGYDLRLHQASEYSTIPFRTEFNAKVLLVMGFSDIPEIHANCPDCLISKTAFKIAVYSELESLLGDERHLWTIDQTGTVQDHKL